MRILTTADQVRRVSGIESATGRYPDYPYGNVIPPEVGQALIDGLDGLDWPTDRDFLNDDGGWIVIYDTAEEFEQRPFGLPPVTLMEDVLRIECRNGETWWHCLALANNETSIDYVFKEGVAPAALLAQLMEQREG